MRASIDYSADLPTGAPNLPQRSNSSRHDLARNLFPETLTWVLRNAGNSFFAP
ncbi:hypothetical protein [Paraburkholderia acidisoli]|uniref:Uncharacterized protein n=1 Tax=Paraburkholderia acidisoli TaxID=2571748 RepID=A0A7Z2GL42_9BURK|nr:hypothetical protein [Paraburkholderia acidisoli]QGZ63807.1 hypothetical protein FAZ98_18800 [Paraburkholderia acidisoli]